jgi:hypothetical protein
MKKYKGLLEFYLFIKDIGFRITDILSAEIAIKQSGVISLKYEDWVISIIIKHEIRWNISYNNKTLSIENNQRNFTIDDKKLLINLFKDVIRDKKLNELGI